MQANEANATGATIEANDRADERRGRRRMDGMDGRVPLVGGVKLVCVPSVTPMDAWSVHTAANSSNNNKVSGTVATEATV